MTPKDLKEVQTALGVSVPKMADMLGCSQSLVDKMMKNDRAISAETQVMVLAAIEKKIKENNDNNIVLECLHNKLS